MDHCAFSYRTRIARGVYAVYRAEGPPRATVGLRQWGGHWHLDQVRGPGNAAVPPALIAEVRAALGGMAPWVGRER